LGQGQSLELRNVVACPSYLLMRGGKGSHSPGNKEKERPKEHSFERKEQGNKGSPKATTKQTAEGDLRQQNKQEESKANKTKVS
jgi:hypothetical protein